METKNKTLVVPALTKFNRNLPKTSKPVFIRILKPSEKAKLVQHVQTVKVECKTPKNSFSLKRNYLPAKTTVQVQNHVDKPTILPQVAPIMEDTPKIPEAAPIVEPIQKSPMWGGLNVQYEPQNLDIEIEDEDESPGSLKWELNHPGFQDPGVLTYTPSGFHPVHPVKLPSFDEAFGRKRKRQEDSDLDDFAFKMAKMDFVQPEPTFKIPEVPQKYLSASGNLAFPAQSQNWIKLDPLGKN